MCEEVIREGGKGEKLVKGTFNVLISNVDKGRTLKIFKDTMTSML